MNWFRWLWWDGGANQGPTNVYGVWSSSGTSTTSFSGTVRYPVSSPAYSGGPRRRISRSIWKSLKFWARKPIENPIKVYGKLDLSQRKSKTSFVANVIVVSKFSTKSSTLTKFTCTLSQKSKIEFTRSLTKLRVVGTVQYPLQEEELSEEELVMLSSL